jgi:hypothetical protein
VEPPRRHSLPTLVIGWTMYSGKGVPGIGSASV